jgi:hypothetical protein
MQRKYDESRGLIRGASRCAYLLLGGGLRVMQLKSSLNELLYPLLFAHGRLCRNCGYTQF